MSLCEFEDDDGVVLFRCARQATHRVMVRTDPAGNPPYELLYCTDHAAFYQRPHEELVATVVELPHLATRADAPPYE